jgi:hypothetical protein
MTTGLEIHRLLDEAFAGIEMTAEAQDLKEEMRGNLTVRVSELEQSGLPADQAARRAIAELGDIRSIVDDLEAPAARIAPWNRNRVRPRANYVVRTVVAAVLGAAGLAVVAVPFFGVDVALAWQFTVVGAVALIAGIIVADALGQETTTNYPVPRARAFGYGAATTLALAGGGFAALRLRDGPLPWLIGGGVAVLVAIIAFTYLGATQTNRHKPWVVRMAAEYQQAGDRFSQDPAAAARFGIYTVAIWLMAFAAFGVLSFTVGWAWSWLALVAGVVAMMLTLARMLFIPSTVDKPRG